MAEISKRGKNLIGQKFGRLTVVEYAGLDRHKKRLWKCSCECSGVAICTTSDLTTGNSKSCGCFKSEVASASHTRHGMRHHKLYDVWYAMKARCEKSDDPHFKYYGARGIRLRFESFEAFHSWAVESGYEDGLSIDRIDVNGDYCPENCRWAIKSQQCRNRRNNVMYKGKCLAEWCEELGLKYDTIKMRILRGMPIGRALGLEVD